MKKTINTVMKLAFVSLLFPVEGFSRETETPRLGVDPVKEVIAAMTIEEKVNFIKGLGVAVPSDDGPIAGSVEGKVPGAAGLTYEIPRLGIPSIVLADGPAGLRIDPVREGDPNTYYATAFPAGTSIASSWNVALVEKVGKAMGRETLEYGVDVILAPGMNIQRNPLCGRNFEYYSEDPVLSGKIGAAMVRGIQSNGVGVSVKHYAANNQETSRNTIDEIISQRALREIYLRGFEIMVRESEPWTVMSSYNKINGVYTSESYELLTTVLRDEWGFGGLVMTDWFGGRNFPDQVKAGNDLLMPGRVSEYKKVMEAYQAGYVSEAELDRNIERILNLILITPSFRGYEYSNQPDLQAHAAIAREAAAEGMVLLKNESGALPIRSGRVALLGNASYDTFVGGTGSGEVNNAYAVTFYEGLQSQGFGFYENLAADYLAHIETEKKARPPKTNLLQAIKPVDEMDISPEAMDRMAEATDIAVMTVGRNAGEGSDRDVEADYYLNTKELELIGNASRAFRTRGKKLVVVLNIDAVVDVARWRDMADAIIISWLPGQEAGNAMAEVVKGVVNPSGRLTQTLSLSYGDVPSSGSFPGTPAQRPRISHYNEGIYVGYRYYDTFGKSVAYGFGHGLSYTDFEIGTPQISSSASDGQSEITVVVKNTGKTAGKEVVQVYISAPGSTMDKPERELRAFAKTGLLEPGGNEKITFSIGPQDLASFDSARSAWIAEPGTYIVKIGNSGCNISQKAEIVLKDEIIVQRVHDVLKPQQELKEMNPRDNR